MECKEGLCDTRGTLGFFAKRKVDGRIGLVTCKHVVEGKGSLLFNPDESEDEHIAAVEGISKNKSVDAAFATLEWKYMIDNPPQMKNEPRYFKSDAKARYEDTISLVCFSTATSPNLVTGRMLTDDAIVPIYVGTVTNSKVECEASSSDQRVIFGDVITSNFTGVFDNLTDYLVECDFQCEVRISDVRNGLTYPCPFKVKGKVRGRACVKEGKKLAGKVEGTEAVLWHTRNEEFKLKVIVKGDYTGTLEEGVDEYKYKSQIKISTHQPVCPGDSGSLVRELKYGKDVHSPEQYESRPLGVLFSGFHQKFIAYANPIQHVLEELHVDLY